MRKVFVQLTVNAVLNIDEGVEVADAIAGATITLESPNNEFDADTVDIVDHEVIGSK